MNFELSWKKSGEDKYWTLNFLLIEKFDFALQAGFLNIWTYFFDIIGISSSMQYGKKTSIKTGPIRPNNINFLCCIDNFLSWLPHITSYLYNLIFSSSSSSFCWSVEQFSQSIELSFDHLAVWTSMKYFYKMDLNLSQF